MSIASTNNGAPLIRVLRHAVRLPHLRRFITAVRQEGWGIAAAKARQFLTMEWRGSSHTVLRETAPAPAPPNQVLHGIWQQLAQGDAFHVSAPPCQNTQRYVAIIGDLNLPQCRKYRVEQLAGFWQAQGVACDFAHYEDLPRVMRLLSRATHVVEYRLPSTPMTEMLRYEVRRLRLPILYDIDDPLFSVSAYETYGNMAALDPSMKRHFVSETSKYLSMMNGADMISVSTPGLAEHAALYSTRPIHVRRNFADKDTLQAGARARARHRGPDGVFRVAFASGSQGHEADFAEIAEMMETFVTAAPKRRLALLGHIDLAALPQKLRDRTDAKPFSNYQTYLDLLARADCAVMPLADDLFNRCKSAVRVIDAAAVSIPSIVSPVGDLPNVITHGKTGLVAHAPDDWLKHLESLAASRSDTARMGSAARQALETTWAGRADSHIIDQQILDWVQS